MSRRSDKSLFESGELFDTGRENAQKKFNHFIRVAFDSGVDSEFDYGVADEFWPVEAGQRIEVPFGRGNKKQQAFCVAADIEKDEIYCGPGKARRIKGVAAVLDKEPLLDDGLLQLARWMSEYYVCPLGQVLAAMVPGAVKKGAGAKKERFIYLVHGWQEKSESLRGVKQKAVIEILSKAGAFSEENTLAVSDVYELADCKSEIIRKLAEKQLIVVCRRVVMKALPVLPDSMVEKSEDVVLNEDQRKALQHIEGLINSEKFAVSLLHGVTDSGKTEVYIRAIESVLKKGRRTIVLLPEIALTAQTVQRFVSRFERIAVMHSGLTAAQRNCEWQRIRKGDADVIIGARSAVFAPVSNLGLIVIDEEHEPSYKQDTVPRYSGRDVAIKRMQLSGGVCLLGSATPSLETLCNCIGKSHFSLMELPKRVKDLAMPEMRLVDMKEHLKGQRNRLIADPLRNSLRSALARGEQAILLLNRRGYSNIVFCGSCKHSLKCRNCDVSLTFHKGSSKADKEMNVVTGRHMYGGLAVCHYCGSKTLVPEKCPLCGKKMTMIGVGAQRLEEELTNDFPQAKVARIDSDSMAGGDYFRLLSDFSKGKIDILAGTQILAKGLHFPNVTVVGIISADTCLYIPDFRSSERTYQLLSQVAGRTGRSEKKGVVFVQSYMPEQPAIGFAIKNDFKGFVREELKHRKSCNLPPYWKLARVIMRDENFDRLEHTAERVKNEIDTIAGGMGLQMQVRGPMAATITRIQRSHRMQIIIQCPTGREMAKLFNRLRFSSSVKGAGKVLIDVDPVNLL